MYTISHIMAHPINFFYENISFVKSFQMLSLNSGHDLTKYGHPIFWVKNICHNIGHTIKVP